MFEHAQYSQMITDHNEDVVTIIMTNKSNIHIFKQKHYFGIKS